METSGDIVTCPTSFRCFAVEELGPRVWVSGDLANSGHWTEVDLSSVIPTHGPLGAPSIAGIACPVSNLCVLIDDGPDIAVSTEPSSNSSWKITTTKSIELSGIGCPSVTLCIAVDTEGTVLVGRAS